MKYNSINYIKSKMLNEFEKEIEDTFNNYQTELLTTEECISILNSLRGVWSCCRIDLKNYGKESNSLEFIEHTNNLNIHFPNWFANEEGKGCKIEDEKTDITLKFKCVGNGNLKIVFRGTDFRNVNDKSIRNPVYINFKNFTINAEKVFTQNTLTWHNDSYIFNRECTDGDVFNLNIEFDTIYDFYPELKQYLSNLGNKEDLIISYIKIKKYIKYEKMMLHVSEFDDNTLDIFNFIKNEQIELNKEYEDVVSDYNTFLSLRQNYNNYVKLDNSITNLNDKIDKINDKLDLISHYIDSNNILFNTLFLDYELKPKRLLNNLQTLCSQLLLFINNVCDKHNIDWWLDYGNLLGAVRHENFIPWDDDMDIGMMRSSYHKFVDIISDEIKKYNLNDCINIYYRPRKWEGKTINAFIQLFVMNEELGNKVMAGIDVFPYDFLSNYDEKTIGPTYNRAQVFFYKKVFEGSQKSKLYMGVNHDEVMKEYSSELDLSYEKQKYIIPGVEGSFGYKKNLYELKVLETDKIFPLTKVKYGDHYFPAPKDYHYYLSNIYGNYMSVPKSIRTHLRVNNFRKEPYINEIFENHINMFKKANDQF